MKICGSGTRETTPHFTLKNIPAGDYRIDVNVTMTDDGELFQFLGSIDTVTIQPMQTMNLRITVRVIRQTIGNGGYNAGEIVVPSIPIFGTQA